MRYPDILGEKKYSPAQKRGPVKRAEQWPALTQGTVTTSVHTTQLTLFFVFLLKGGKYFPGSWKQSFSINLPFACCFTKIQRDTKQTPEFHTKEGGELHSAMAGHSCLQAKK